MVAEVVGRLRGIELSTPFPRLTYREAMARYGTDKPDIRFGMEIADLSALFRATSFRAFAGSLEEGGSIRGLNAGPQNLSRSALDGLGGRAQELGARGLVWIVVEEDGSFRSPQAKYFSQDEQAGLSRGLAVGPGDVLLLIADWPARAAAVLGQLRVELGKPSGQEELAFLWVIDFPVFEETDDGRLVPSHHPFTSPVDVGEMRERPGEAIARAYDLVLNGSELGSGSVRIHDPEIQKEVFEILGISDEQAQRRFGWFVEALRYGTPPHAGFALGIDRLLAVLLDEGTIRDVIPFPKSQTGIDRMTGSPTRVDDEQLQELGIDLRPEVRSALAADQKEG